MIHYQSTLIHQVGNNRKKNDKTVLMSLTIDSRDTLSTALRVRTKTEHMKAENILECVEVDFIMSMLCVMEKS